MLLVLIPLSAIADPLELAEEFIDAFYSWDSDTLAQTLSHETEGYDRVIYYQGWAEGGNYAIKERRPCSWVDRTIQCPITVTDDFGKTLGYTATDTFHLTINESGITRVIFTADDPPIFDEFRTWISADRPEIFFGVCKNLFVSGTTPGDCARTVAQAAKDFMAIR